MVRKEGNVMSVGKRIYLKREMPDMEVMNQFKSIPAPTQRMSWEGAVP